jgi:hypothetical protein
MGTITETPKASMASMANVRVRVLGAYSKQRPHGSRGIDNSYNQAKV